MATTTLELARAYLETAGEAVTNVELHEYVARHSGQSRDVIHGTLDCTGRGTLIDSAWYTKHWYKDHSDSGRVIHRRHKTITCDITLQREMNFDCPMKKLSCQRIMSYLPTSGSPRVLTLASVTGNCVQAAVAQNSATCIDNVECREDVLQLWKLRKKSLGIETEDYLGTFQDYVKTRRFTAAHYDLINADVMGYACKSMFQYLDTINSLKNATYIALTAQALDEFRNHGAFQDELRKKYADSPDKHAECIADWLSNYEMIDRYTYKKDEHSATMEVFIFKLAA